MKSPLHQPAHLEWISQWKRPMVVCLWLSVLYSAFATMLAAAFFEGGYRALAILPAAYGGGALRAAIRLRSTLEPTRAHWISGFLFAAIPILNIAASLASTFGLHDLVGVVVR